MSGFQITSKFRQAAELINRTPVEKFPLVLQRILRRLGDVSDEAVFRPEEQAQLCEMFGMNNAELDGVLSACAYFFEHAAYTTMRPRALKEALLQAGMDDAHAELAQQVWAVEATDYVTKLRDRTMVRSTCSHAQPSSCDAHGRLARCPLTGRPEEPRQLPVAASPDDGRGPALPNERPERYLRVRARAP